MTVLKQLSLSRTHKIRVFCVRVPPLVGNSEPPQQQRQQQQQWQKHCQRPSGRLAFVVVAWSIRAAGYSVNDTHTNRLNKTTTELQKQRRTLYILFEHIEKQIFCISFFFFFFPCPRSRTRPRHCRQNILSIFIFHLLSHSARPVHTPRI